MNPAPTQRQAPLIDRPLPQSADAEKGVLGSILIDPQHVLPDCVERITGNHFHHPAHRIIFEAMVELWSNSRAVDLITLTQHLSDRNLIASAGGPAYLSDLAFFVPTAANCGHYLEILREKAILRGVINACTECIRDCYEAQSEIESLVDAVEQRVFAVSESRYQEKNTSMKDQVFSAIIAIEKLYDNRGSITGLATGFKDLDRMTSGLHPAEMIVIAARPSMGKTAIVMNIVEHVALDLKQAVAVFSLEMSNQQLVQRMLCSRARVNLARVRDGFLADRDFPALTSAASELAESKILIDDTPSLSILELRAKARRFKARHDIKLIAIDYLQLLRSTTRRAQDNRQLEIAEISSGIKALAKELDIPIIVLAQLNRNPEARAGGKPRISDLRESGSIEQDADLVALLVRSEVYEDDPEAKEEKSGEAELIIAKQRNGPIGEVPLTFLKEFTRFVDRAPARASKA